MTGKHLLPALLCLALCAGGSGIAAAAQVESHQRILDTARNFLAQQLKARSGKSEIHIGALDHRLRLARCDAPLQGYLPAGGQLAGNTSVGVRCTGSQAWKLYVPARIAVLERVVVSRGYLPRGTVLGEEHIVVSEREVSVNGHGYIRDPGEALGKMLRQPVQDGRVVTPAMLARPKLVKRGDEVVILSQGGSFEVRMRGSALGDGAEGDRIRVRNLNSKRIVEGRVNADGSVIVRM
jgi:flagella basal body P-ring formation protein FlgA